MRLQLLCLASAILVFSEFLCAVAQEEGVCNDLLPRDDQEMTNEERRSACNNFYQYVCNRPQGVTAISRKSLKEKLYEKLKDILGEDAAATGSTSHDEGSHSDAMTSVKSMAKTLYTACRKDLYKNETEKVKESVLQILDLLGIKKWPFIGNNEKASYEELLNKIGLRPFANILTVPNEENGTYILTVNIPFPRFALPPNNERKEKDQKYRKYKDFLSSVVKLFLGRARKDSSSDVQPEERATTPRNNKKDGRLTRVVNDILSIEMKISELIRNSTPHNQLVIKTLQEWEEEFKGKFPFAAALQADFEKAGVSIKPTDPVGILNVKYLEAVGNYSSSLSTTKLANYFGWYFIRDIADVLTEGVREKLNAFLDKISKPKVPVNLTENACIEKLIGYQGVMENAVAHVYLATYFNKTFIDKASSFAPHLNSSVKDLIDNNSWMDKKTRITSTKWLSNLIYHIGAPQKLLNETQVKDMFCLVNITDKDKDLLPVHIFQYRMNNFLQNFRLYMQPYIKEHIWAESALKTYGRYSEFYTSLEIPAASLQDPIFKLSATLSHLYGSTATFTAETMAYGFAGEGRKETGKKEHQWSGSSRRAFRQALNCLKKARQKNNADKKQMSSQEQFDDSKNEADVEIKMRDHISLRTSFSAFKHVLEECKVKRPEVQDWEASKREFFVSYAQRHCEDGTDKNDEHRVNYALKTFEEFWTAFGCQAGERMKGNDTCEIVTGRPGTA